MNDFRHNLRACTQEKVTKGKRMSWHLGKTFATKSFLHTVYTDCRHCVHTFAKISLTFHTFLWTIFLLKTFFFLQNAFIYTSRRHTHIIRKDTVMTIIVRYWWKEEWIWETFFVFHSFLFVCNFWCLFVFNWHSQVFHEGKVRTFNKIMWV